ncbi:MAG: restriction endonuclease, partial [Candidatus Electryoneaceae bacterium]|nr:restriction endonuclease [Candidatus Electryoneaceae bacterium]
NRQWIGVDISHLAVRLILDRLLDSYEDKPQERNQLKKSIDINGFPKDIATAKELAVNPQRGRFKFQDWIVEIMLSGVANPKKVGDGGYDGYITFLKGDKEKGVILIEVKSGHVGVTNVREFIHVVDTVNAHLGIFVCFEDQLTKGMLLEAKSAGHFEPDLFGKRYDRIQILTVEQLLEGIYIDFPAYQNSTFKKASPKTTSGTPSMDMFQK